jgi:hypothetical protein
MFRIVVQILQEILQGRGNNSIFQERGHYGQVLHDLLYFDYYLFIFTH